MEQDSSWSIGEDDIEWWNSYTRLFVQDLYSKDPKKRMASFYFRPINMEAALFYNSCGHDLLLMITYVQMSLLEECCKAYHQAGRRPCQLFFKAEPRVLPQISGQLITLMDSLRSQKIELILDVNLPNHKNDKEWQKSLFKIIDSGHMVCLGGYNWKDNEPQDFQMVKGLFKYVRLGPPPSNLAEVNHFVDTCFYIKEKLVMQLILDRVKSQTDLDIACRTPFFALMGDYISTAHLAKNLEDVSYKVML
ncbi:hypothetical protein GOY18_08510 [Aeromonas hydrophila]|uniref:hypothetical protein n=1 Tax=Aeromonas hydrophila TaxID=644 RepID=UPI001C5AC0CA|nr:hypothetical protein [Aeromonas hydrophila]MBW3811356.1 hypothetical protein [Aeromonas hydrophila]